MKVHYLLIILILSSSELFSQSFADEVDVSSSLFFFSDPAPTLDGQSATRLSQPSFADLNGDGDLDFICGFTSSGFGTERNYQYFKNIGTVNSPVFDAPMIDPFNLSIDQQEPAPAFIDLDGDEDVDMLTVLESGDLIYHENVGSTSSPDFATGVTNPFNLGLEAEDLRITLVDIDSDGDLDIYCADQRDDVLYYIENQRIDNQPPTASNLSIDGALGVGEKLTGEYVYSDVEDDEEDGTIIRWYRAEEASGTNATQITGADSLTYLLTEEELGMFIAFEVRLSDKRDRGETAITSYTGPVLDVTAPVIAESSITNWDEDVPVTTGNTSNVFSINSSGSLLVNNSEILDFELNPSFALTITVSDGGLSTEAMISVLLNDVDDIVTGVDELDELKIHILELDILVE